MLLNFTLILKNNTSNEVKVYNNLSGKMTLTKVSFDKIIIDEPDGEYEYLLFLNYRDDVDYIFYSKLLDSVVKIKNTYIPIKNLRPLIGMLKIVNNKIENSIYEDSYNLFFYNN